MLFSRRTRLSIGRRLLGWLWPRRGWSRSLRYWRLRYRRLEGSPSALAMGLGIGVFASFVPVLGAQLLLALAIAQVARANLAAAVIGSFFGTPVTYPVMWALSLAAGSLVVGAGAEGTAQALASGADRLWLALWSGSQEALYHSTLAIWPVYLPLLVGGLMLGLLAGTIAYCMALAFAAAREQARPGKLSPG